MYIIINCVNWIGSDYQYGIQKFHYNKVSRIGGLGIAISNFSGIFFIRSYYPSESFLAFLLLVSFLPIFLGGLLEDITHKVSPVVRILLACISSLLVCIITKANISYTDIILIDTLLNIPVLSFIITSIIIVGFLNSINIIDGFHGVASGSTLIMLISFSILSFILNDYLILRITLIIIIANLGFIVWNWPYGKIFLGDSGAYLLGIWVVVIGILIPHRSNNISPMATVLIGAYPMIETIFSVYRRKLIKIRPVTRPDALHLHSLIFRRLLRGKSLLNPFEINKFLNYKVAFYVWFFVVIDSILAIIFMDNTNILLLCIFLTMLLYIVIYYLIVNFKTPKFLIIYKI